MSSDRFGYSDQQLGSLKFYDDKGKPVDITPKPYGGRKPNPDLPEGQGGLIQQSDSNITPSNVLINNALGSVPESLAAMKNKVIGRPKEISADQAYGQPGGALGVYHFPQGNVDVTRGGPDEGYSAQHELTHALAYESKNPAIKADAVAGFPYLSSLVRMNRAALISKFGAATAGGTGGFGKYIDEKLADPPHLFTEFAQAYMQGTTFPPAIQGYLRNALGPRKGEK